MGRIMFFYAPINAVDDLINQPGQTKGFREHVETRMMITILFHFPCE
jgi:hypothetical protein